MICANVVKSLFAASDSNSLNRRCGDRIKTWGTTPPCVKLTGDSGDGFEAALMVRPLAGNQRQRLLGLLQQNRRKVDIGTTADFGPKVMMSETG
jgi:hypothetical protein